MAQEILLVDSTNGRRKRSGITALDLVPLVTGSRASPQNITAAGGIAFAGTRWKNIWFVQGSGGAVDITATLQIAAGTNVGQELILIGRSNDNTILFEDGNGLSLRGSYDMGLDMVLELIWDGTNWVEKNRS